jgi:hypothetical protein
MGLFDFFKKKDEPLITDGNGIKLLSQGLLLEDSDIFIPWDTPIDQYKLYSKKEFRADRVIYNWGERRILNGLPLDLVTVCWNHKQDGNIRKFGSVEFLAAGDEAQKYFELIMGHLNDNLGTARKADVDFSLLEWRMGGAKLILELLDRYGWKLNFRIEKGF